MGKLIERDVRVYMIDEPGFLSCGSAYFTDTNNGIILYEGQEENDFTFRSRNNTPYTLAPFPVPNNHNWSKLLEVGTKVYPSCNVDQPSMGYGDKKEFHPTITGGDSLIHRELEGFLETYKKQLGIYNARTSRDLKRLNAELLEELEQWARSREAILTEKYAVPSLVKLIKGKLH
jgi:hypothetical protein